MRLSQIDYRKWAYITVCIFGALAFAFIFFKFLIPIALPFLISWAIAFPVRQAAHFLHRKTKIPVRVASLILTALFIVGIFLLLFLLARQLISELGSLFAYLTQNPDMLSDMMSDVKGFLCSIVERLPFDTDSDSVFLRVEEYLESFMSESVSALVAYLPRLIGSIAIGLPSIIFFILVTTISAFYFCLDLTTINNSVLSVFPQKIRVAVSSFKRGVFKTALRYIRAYLTLMLIIFAMLLIGFLILGVEYSLLLAVIFALVDVLPVLGVGILIIPWAIFCLITGKIPLGIGLLILYAVVTVVRQYAEPRVIGKHFGIHPRLTLVAMYAGVQLFGFVGMILGPVGVVFLKGVLKKPSEKSPPTVYTNKILPKS